jgi:Zn-dependent peptidase ImmA (M78 family)
MEKKQVISRMSQESYDRLQELSKKYGVSSSALLVLLVNERWLAEHSQTVKALDGGVSEVSENSARTRKSRHRHKSKRK